MRVECKHNDLGGRKDGGRFDGNTYWGCMFISPGGRQGSHFLTQLPKTGRDGHRARHIENNIGYPCRH